MLSKAFQYYMYLITSCKYESQWFATGRCLSPGTPVSSTNKTDRHEITEILVKVTLSTIKQTNKQYHICSKLRHVNMKFVNDSWQVDGFLQVLMLTPPIKLTEILLKVALNTITLTSLLMWWNGFFLNNEYIGKFCL